MLVSYRSRLTSAAVCVLAVTLAACGGSPTAAPDVGPTEAVATYDRLNAMSGQARTDELVRLAKDEGELSVYTSNNDIQELVDAFEAKYDIHVDAYRANSETVLQRLLQEQQAGFHGVDVLETNAAEMNVVDQQGLLSPYAGELRDKVRPEGQKENWTADRFNAFVVAWNTNLVKPGEEPKSFEDLTDPRWKGKVSMEISDFDWYAALHAHYESQGWTEERIDALFAGIAANAVITKGHTVQAELLGAGQFAVAVSAYSSSTDFAAVGGAPETWQPAQGRPVEPIVLRANGIGLMTTAKHPAAAMLFVDFVLTDGQKVLESVKRIPSVTGGWDPLVGLQTVEVPEAELLANPKKWDQAYTEMTKKGAQSN